MNPSLPRVFDPPSPLASAGVTTCDNPANRRFPSGTQGGQAATRVPHGSGNFAETQTQARRSDGLTKTQTWFATGALAIGFWVAFLGTLFASSAFAKCHTHRCWQRVHAHRAQHWLKVHRPWVHAWRHLSSRERFWAHCIASYETRGIPWSQKARTATGNGYYGATQWLPSTWHSAGGSGLPIEHSLHEQLVRTVRWAHVAGSSQWSTSRWCGSV